jgi:FtsH-binding integral membrane protein
LSVVGVGLFSISTAVTVQKVVKMEHELAPQYHDRAAIIGAMMLYTNFINLFLRLLEIYARSQSNKR